MTTNTVGFNINEQLAVIKRGADELLIEAELIEKLKKGKPLRIKAVSYTHLDVYKRQ